MPYKLNGQLVLIKSQTLPHAAGAVAAAGGGAFVAMSAAVAALSGAAMSNAETAAMPNEVTFMAFPIRRQFTSGGIFAAIAVEREAEVDFYIAFPRIVATGTQHKVKSHNPSARRNESPPRGNARARISTLYDCHSNLKLRGSERPLIAAERDTHSCVGRQWCSAAVMPGRCNGVFAGWQIKRPKLPTFETEGFQ